ncbi:MAG: response regulator transcription factor [Lachnospiraceae bacterium]|nr:response regulator transcription factor [Lachnospiraceae bacterium]
MRRDILIIDDDEDLSMIISDMLTDQGYRVTCAKDSETAFGLLSERKFDLILLDINLPDAIGFDVCKELRRVSEVPVIFASARTSETDRIIGLDIGGDDYIPKPFSMKELLSHIKALMRRTYGFSENDKTVTFGGITVDIGSRTVMKDGKEVNLSLREFDLLAYLCEHPNIALPKDKLLSEVWGAFSEVAPTTLAVHIRWLREKLEDDPADPKYIKTVYKVGYILEIGI